MNIKEPKIGTHHLGLKVTFEHRTNAYGDNQVFICIHMKDGSREYYVVESVSTDMKSMTQEYTLITGETLMVDKEDSGFGPSTESTFHSNKLQWTSSKVRRWSTKGPRGRSAI